MGQYPGQSCVILWPFADARHPPTAARRVNALPGIKIYNFHNFVFALSCFMLNDSSAAHTAMLEALTIGPAAAMRRAEQARGYAPVFLGDVPWFSADDWRADPVVSLDGKRVRIMAIWAKSPCTGAFGRLIDGILSAGLIPIVISPFPAMRSVLIRWGWRGKQVGDTFEDGHTQWFAPRKWREQRVKRP